MAEDVIIVVKESINVIKKSTSSELGVKNQKEVFIYQSNEEEERRLKKASSSKKKQIYLTIKLRIIVQGNENQM